MAKSVLVDSSFYIRRLKSGRDPMIELAGFAPVIDFSTCGIVRAEVLRGIRSVRERDYFRSAMDIMINVPLSNVVIETVCDLAWRLDRRGLPMQITDLIIAACALYIDADLLTFDRDFQNIPGLRVIDTLS